jgi:hypothetical protein
VKKWFSMFALLIVACASGAKDDSPVTVRISGVNVIGDLRFAGPISTRFRVEVTNPTNEPVTLRKIEIHTAQAVTFSVRMTTPFTRVIGGGQTVEVELNATGTSSGGKLADEEQVTLRGTAYFDSPHGAFVKMFGDFVRLQ